MRVPSRPRTWPGAALVLALLAASAYTVFASGAAGLPEETRLQVALAVIAMVAAVGWIFGGSISLRASGLAWVGIALLAGFAAWTGITLLWSVAPDRTWIELNRGLAYVLVLLLAVAAGSSAVRAVERVAIGWLVVAVACALYAVGGKLLPGVNVPGVFDLNHVQLVSRLRAPLEYWNALALVVVLGVPVAMRLATDVARRTATRLAALAALFVLIIALGMTYSRGGVVALLVAVGIATLLGGARLRGLLALAVALTAALPVLGFAFTRPALVGNGVELSERIADGRLLLAVFAGALVVLLAAAWALLRWERRVRWSPARSRAVWRVAAAGAAVLAVLAVSATGTFPGGPTGFASAAADSFTETRGDAVSDPVRLVSSSSGNRWVWWEEAVGAWSDRPLTGWGAGSFPVTHLQYRQVALGVSQPHSVPLQFLAETGLVGALLALGGLGLLFAAALERVRAMSAGRERDLAVALLAGAVAWLVHGLYDWDWDIPGVTVPALLFLGVLATRPSGPRVPRPGALAVPESGGGPGARGLGLAAVCLLLALVSISAILPAWADSKASAGLSLDTQATEAQREEAAADAELAARLNPLEVRGLLAAASIAEGRGRLLDAKRYLLDAVQRQPSNADAWLALARIAFLTADRQGMEAASRHLLELDPIGTEALSFAERTTLFTVPAASSPTATGTPLSPGLVPVGSATPTPAPEAAGSAAGAAQPTTPAPAPAEPAKGSD